jgi:Fe-S-cluster containining protein
MSKSQTDVTSKSGDTPSVLSSAPIDEIWRRAVAQLGLRVVRTDQAYATSDGRGVIGIGIDATLDGDDAFAQLVCHELCHAITEGEGALGRPDWGLENVAEHVVREHACLRVQAHIAARFGLRGPMAPTTSYRGYYEELPADPLQAGADPAIPIARDAVARFDRSAWRAVLEGALAETAALLERSDPRPSHPVGFPLGPGGETCATCAWLYSGGRGAAVARCRQTAPAVGDGARTDPAHQACVRWEPPVDCRTCGACCREAYHSVTVAVRDPVVWQQPDLIVRTGHRFEIRREGDRCAALTVAQAPPDAPNGGPPAPAYTCSIYEDRPRPCREFTAGGRNCLEARRRVGLSA